LKFIGVMTGTSLDGLDACLIDCQPNRIERIESCSHPMPAGLQAQLASLLDDHTPLALDAAARASVALSDAVADLIKDLLGRTGLAPGAITALGVHGQTVRHAPTQGYSLQLVHAPRLAERTGIDVAFDFRNRDIAAGGQGAPLVPPFHAAMVCQSMQAPALAGPVAVLNLGGIANLSCFEMQAATDAGEPAGNQPAEGRLIAETLVGFDTGPANTLLDGWAQRHIGKPFDPHGAWAAQGTACPALLAQCKSDDFFKKPPPKSTGRDHFHLEWLARQIQALGEAGSRLDPVDVQATLLALTVDTVTEALPQGLQALWVCGGGAKNDALMQALSRRLPMPVRTTDALGWPSQDIEAAAFGWLAWRLHQGLPGNVPAVTGARGPRLLGCWAPA
jgi:anhydro-N-acetylmuramic acid kinase